MSTLLPASILLPGDDAHWTDDYTSVKVIASQWGNDDPNDGPVWFVALLLHPSSPYYEVAEFTWNATAGVWEQTADHGFALNINDAVRLYADNGGDN